ncbi:MAG: electron transfer flavoprotein subunit alpha/FixB family protein [Pseudomonadota bacterium]
MTAIFAYIPIKNDTADDVATEFLTAARKIDANACLTAVLTGTGDNLKKVADDMAKLYSQVIRIDHADLAYPNAEVVRKALVNTIPPDAIFLVAHDTFGMDLAPGLSIKMDSAYAADIVDLEGIDGTTLKAVRQELGGAVSTHVAIDISSGAVLTIRPGSFAPADAAGAGGTIVDKSGEAGDLSSKRKFLEVVVAQVGDVDITKSDVLVSVGRGIEEQENIELAQELAEAMNAVVSCSRPIVDAKWLEKSRQVGTSGQTVKPKVYMAMGISGSFQHLGGIKGNPFIVAVNKNPKAPIFQVADVGIVQDILEFMPELTAAIKDL